MREFDLIQRFIASGPAMPKSITIPPGDDMAGLRIGGEELLVAVDQIIDKVHFDLATASPKQIGRKAVTRNLSDVAAMAGKPLATLVSAILPHGMKSELAEEIHDALRHTAEAYSCPLIGGDTATHDGPLTLSVTILATADGIAPVLRKGASIGDKLYVTGQLGGSRHPYNGYTHHLDFEPRVAVARSLAGNDATRPTAMIDLSDGLARDVQHLVPGVLIESRALPVSAVARQHSARDGRPGWMHAVADGEDYELLFTAKPDALIPLELDGVRISHIGQVVEEPGILLHDGTEYIALNGLGWEHHS